jgi:hypothetical protein
MNVSIFIVIYALLFVWTAAFSGLNNGGITIGIELRSRMFFLLFKKHMKKYGTLPFLTLYNCSDKIN